MAFSRGRYRSPLCLQRGLVGLIVLCVVVYGSLLFTFWTSKKLDYTPAPHTFVRHQALKGMLNQHGDAIEPMALVRINSEDDTTSPSTNWKNLPLEMLPDVGSPESMKRTATYGFRDEKGSSVDSDVASTEEQDQKTSSQPSSESVTTLPKADYLELLQTKAEEHARSVNLLPPGETRTRAFKCIGWRNTGNCDPNGPREPQKDLGCSDLVPKDASGYCEVEDTVSGERFRVTRRACNILRNRVPFRCVNAPAFARFPVQAAAAMKNIVVQDVSFTASDTQPRDGIVMVVYPKLVPSAFATIRALREILHCSLPIEIWFRPDEMEGNPDALVPLKKLAKDTAVGEISFHEIVDPVAKRFVAKIYAINHSFFDRVLFLDADNVPVRDPKFLFDSAEFIKTGAIFWPDFWHPTSTMFGLHSKSLLWELLDMDFVDMFEQESGQLVVDRRRHAAPLKLVLFYATHEPNFLVHYKLAWGDKDLFRLAWLKLNSSFHMIETPPAMAGMVVNASAFCGMTMVQHDVKGNVLFLHRNKNKLTGSTIFNSNSTTDPEVEPGVDDKLGPPSAPDKSFHPSGPDSYPDPAIWTHLMSFNNGWSRDEFIIQAFTTSLEFTNKQKCFGRRSLRYSPQFRIQEVTSLSFAEFETKLRQFAQEAANLVPQH